MTDWKYIGDELPPIGEAVLFYCGWDAGISDIGTGVFQGEWTLGDAVVMVTGEDDDWLPCSHWKPLTDSLEER